MFTGLVQDVGRIARIARSGDSAELEIAVGGSPRLEPAGGLDAARLELGESVAVEGACLTVTQREAGRFRVLAGPETLRRTTLGALRVGSPVNLERALLATERLGGHIVAGHVDGVGDLSSRRQQGATLELGFRAPASVLRYVVEKGSIAIDGISLTVNRVDEYAFAVALIPHTISHTTLAAKGVGSRVNLEVDIVGKYVEKFVKEHLSR